MDEYFNNLFKGIDDNIILDKEQRDVILCDSERVMVIAGAGSGKTTTMVAKVKYLVDIKKIDPKSIILISFTNKAVLELKTRINQQMNIPCCISTFHSLAFSILKKNGYNYKIMSNPQIIVENYFKYNKKEAKILKSVKYSTEILKLYKNNEKVFHHKNKFWHSFLKLYKYYNEYMKEHNLIDFEDIIIKCNALLRKNILKVEYKYIIIDEFQDISNNRYELIENIYNVSNCRIIAVGDDWQAIFSFAGSRVDLFLTFCKHATTIKIINTYRNSQELINIAGSFILKNKAQIEKNLKSTKRIKTPIKIIGFLKSTKALCKALDLIVAEYGLEQKVLLIGRYQFDINNYIDDKRIKIYNSKIIYVKYPDLNIEFLTVHKSKGLGYDNVIILNMNNGIYGFPSLQSGDKVKQKLLKEQEAFLYAEERRLFYVAITRTKNKVYILYKLNHKSMFVKELIKHYKIKDNKIIF